jgi:hypothetical protein
MKEEETKIVLEPARCYHRYCKTIPRVVVLFDNSQKDCPDMAFQITFYCLKHFKQIRKLSVAKKIKRVFYL